MTGILVAVGFALLFVLFVRIEQRGIEASRRMILIQLRRQGGWPTGPELVARVEQKAFSHYFYTAVRSLERDGLVIHREGEGTPARGGRPSFHYALTVDGKAAAWRVIHGMPIKVRA